MDHNKASVPAEVVQAQSNSSESYGKLKVQDVSHFSDLSMVLRPYLFYFPLHPQEPSMVPREEAQEQEVGVQMSVVCQMFFFWL